MRDYPQVDHADLGLVDGQDLTEDLRPTKNAPGRAGTRAEGDQNTTSQQQKES